MMLLVHNVLAKINAQNEYMQLSDRRIKCKSFNQKENRQITVCFSILLSCQFIVFFVIRNIFSYSFMSSFHKCKNKLIHQHRLIFKMVNFSSDFTCDALTHSFQTQYLIIFQTYFEILVIVCLLHVSVCISLVSKLFLFNVFLYQLFPQVNYYHVKKVEIIEQFYFSTFEF